MTVPVEEAVAALSTFSLEVQIFSRLWVFDWFFLFLLFCFSLAFSCTLQNTFHNQPTISIVVIIIIPSSWQQQTVVFLNLLLQDSIFSNFHIGSSFSFSLTFSSSDDVFCICECGSVICKCAHNQPNSWILWRARFFQDPQTHQTIACHSKALRFLQWKLLCTTYYRQRWETYPFWVPQMSFDLAALDSCAVFF